MSFRHYNLYKITHREEIRIDNATCAVLSDAAIAWYESGADEQTQPLHYWEDQENEPVIKIGYPVRFRQRTHWWTTSKVRECTVLENGDIEITTLNSKYLARRIE